MRIKKSIKLFNAFFGVFKIKRTGYKNLLILCRLNKAFSLYIPVLTFLLKPGAGYNNAAAVKAVLRIRIIIAGISGVKRLMFYRKKV